MGYSMIARAPNSTDQFISIKRGGVAYCTHPIPEDGVLPQNTTTRAVYREKKPPFEPTIKTKQGVNYQNKQNIYLKNNRYWQDKNNLRTISFDYDYVYYKGDRITQNMNAYAQPSQADNQYSYLMAACHPKEPLSQTDWEIYNAITPIDPNYIGKNRIIALLWNSDITKVQLVVVVYFKLKNGVNFSQRVYIKDFDVGYGDLFYQLLFAGFKTDCLNLIINTSEQEYYDPNMGLYRVEFSSDYTTQNVNKIADSDFNQVNEIQTYTDTTNIDGLNGIITATWTESTINNGGFLITDVFQHKDDFTVIVQKIDNWELDYTYQKTIDDIGNWTRVSTQNSSEIWGYYAYKLIDDELIYHRDLYKDTSVFQGTANDSYLFDPNGILDPILTINQIDNKISFSIDGKMVFASWKDDVYLWVDISESGLLTVTGYTEPYTGIYSNSQYYARLCLLKNNNLSILDEITSDFDGVVDILDSQLPCDEWNFSNKNINKENDWTYYDTEPCVYDDKLILTCLNLHWRHSSNPDYEPRTLKMNIKTGEYSILNNRVDYVEYYPLSITLDNNDS